jgi:ArsR family transcriptional regulator
MNELEQLFKGLADQTRLRIINLLLHGELCVCDIQYVLESPQPNVSRHLAYLKHSGMVLDRREGPRMFYRLAEPGEETRKQLFAFLQQAFAASDEFERDSRKLKKAIERGACTASEWRPLSAIANSADTRAEPA